MSADLRMAFPEAVSLVFNCLDQGADDSAWLPTMALHATDNLPRDVAAIGLDTNILKILRRAPLTTDNLLTFIGEKSVPLIIPGQSAQEYWNNHGAIVRDIDGVYKAVEDLTKKVSGLSVSDSQREAVEQIKASIELLAVEMHDSRRPELLEDSVTFWENILPQAIVCNVPRSSFATLAQVRFAAKTAPGFSDTKKATQNLGDFFVWADFLLGVLRADLQPLGEQSERIVFVTDDDKPDWKASGKPHPVLIGELMRLTGRHLQIMGSKDFQSMISPS
jgi:hypothetical protein